MATEALREQVIAAAVDLFRQKGYHATTTQDIIRAVGCSKGGFYHHFPRKEDLLYLAHETFINYELECAQRILRLEAPPEEKLKRVLTDLIESIALYQAEVTIFFQERHSLNNSPRWGEVKQKRRDYERIVNGLVEAGMASGVFRSDLDPHMVTLGLFGMCNWVYQWYRPGAGMGPQEIAATFITMVLEGLRAPQS